MYKIDCKGVWKDFIEVIDGPDQAPFVVAIGAVIVYVQVDDRKKFGQFE